MALLLALTLWLGASAQPACSEPVEVTFVGSESARASVRVPVTEQLERLEQPSCYRTEDTLALTTIVYPPSDAPRRIRVWVDVSRAGQATVYIADEGWERVLIRHVALAGELDEVARDEIGHIVASSVEALVDGAKIGIAREQAAAELDVAPRPEAPPAPRPTVPPPIVDRPAEPPDPKRRYGIGGGYGVYGWQAPGAPQHGPFLELSISAVVRPGFRLGGRLAGQYFAPIEVRNGDLAVGISGGAVRVDLFASVLERHPFAFILAPHLALDVIRVRPRALAPTGDPFAQSTQVAPILGLRTGPAFALGRTGLVVEVLAGLRINPLDRSYIAQDTGTVIFRPWPVRPGISLALRWTSGRR